MVSEASVDFNEIFLTCADSKNFIIDLNFSVAAILDMIFSSSLSILQYLN